MLAFGRMAAGWAGVGVESSSWPAVVAWLVSARPRCMGRSCAARLEGVDSDTDSAVCGFGSVDFELMPRIRVAWAASARNSPNHSRSFGAIGSLSVAAEASVTIKGAVPIAVVNRCR